MPYVYIVYQEAWKCTPYKSISQSLEGRLEDDDQAEALHEAKHCI